MLYQTINPHGGDLYTRPIRLDFSASTNPLGTPPAVEEAVHQAAGLLNRYPDPYCRELVAAIARYENVPEEQILCGCGAAELIFSYARAKEPIRALEIAPTFSEYAAALSSVGCRVDRWYLKPEEDFLPDGRLLSCVKGGLWDLVVLCNPNNPTGRLFPPALLEELADLCCRRGIDLFVDECYLDMSDQPGHSLKHHLPEMPELFLLKAFTKSFGMAALRLGYCLSGNQALLRDMGRSCQPWNVSLPAQLAGVAALEQREFLRETRRVIEQERPVLAKGLRDLGLEVWPSEANFLLLRADFPLGERLAEQGILVRSCANFPGLEEGWYRIALRTPEENQQLLQAIAACQQRKETPCHGIL